MNVAHWRAITASVRGSSHDLRGAPNQDAVGQSRAWQGGLAAAVADGHGGQRYVRSRRGAELAVELALEEMVATSTAGDSAPLVWVSAQVSRRWRQAVLDDWAGAGFTAEERERAGADLDLDPVLAYGSTLILALCVPGAVHLAQIGDGDVIAVAYDGRVSLPVPGDDRLVAGQTTSLCAPAAASDFRFRTLTLDASGPDDFPAVILLATDGYGAAFADHDWHDAVGRDLLAALREHGLDALATYLPDWLADSARVGGDDTTAALLTVLP